MAVARDLSRRQDNVSAVIGDGADVGVILEAMTMPARK